MRPSGHGRGRFAPAPIAGRPRLLGVCRLGVLTAGLVPAAVAAVLLLTWTTTGQTALRLALIDGASGDEVWAVPVNPGQWVRLRYVHSADRTPVESWFRVSGDPLGLVLEEERYAWYGAGLEFYGPDSMEWETGWVVVRPDRHLSRLPLRVAGTVEQELCAGKARVRLNDLASFGQSLIVEVRP
ncbi:MAG: DUF1850 domain-containing protein [Firmicutes bacterium]|nr:DUF1850 domain-containing protein [Bacillota bacterium]